MLHVRFQERERALVVTPLAPRLDATAAVEFRDAVLASARGRALVIVDLAHVASADASGLAALISIARGLRPGGELRLVGAAPPVRALLSRTGLDELFRPFADVASALPG